MTESRCPACTCIGFHTGDCSLDEMALRDRIVAAMKDRTERDTDWMLADLADAILAIPGIAVVELPEPDYEDSTGYGWNGDSAGGVYAHGGKVYDEEGRHTPAQARAVAAKWLAAADFAERDQ